jgi:murein DD-endopeptidase / murein LD-carboxypeptidase
MTYFKTIFFCSFLLVLSGCSSSKKNTGSATPLQLKYAKILNVSPYYINNDKMYKFIDEWLDTPYKFGGDSKDGIDCSAFIRRLLKEVYNIDVPRTSVDQLLSKKVERYTSSKFLY